MKILKVEFQLPDNIRVGSLEGEINAALAGEATIEILGRRPAHSDTFGSVDPTVFQMLIEILDTKASAAIVSAITLKVFQIIYNKSNEKK